MWSCTSDCLWTDDIERARLRIAAGYDAMSSKASVFLPLRYGEESLLIGDTELCVGLLSMDD